MNFTGVGGHGGTGIHADLKDKYKEIVQKLMNYIVPDLTKYFDTETVISKQFSNDNSSITSEIYSPPIATESAISYQGNPEVRQHHVSFAQQEDHFLPPPHYQVRAQTPVSQSCVCTILWYKDNLQLYIPFLMYNFVPIYLYINSCSHSSHLHGKWFPMEMFPICVCTFLWYTNLKTTNSHAYFLLYKFLLIIYTDSCCH